MIKCLRLRDGDISDEQSWYLEKGYNDHMQAHKDRIEGYFITAEELEQREREAFESGFHKGAEAQDAIEASECTFADVSGLADDYLKQRKGS